MMIFSKILLWAGIALLFLFFYSLARGKNNLAELFSVICLLSSIYVLGYVLELNADNLEQIKFYLKIEYFGISFIPFLWFLFAYRFYYNKNPSFKVALLAAVRIRYFPRQPVIRPRSLPFISTSNQVFFYLKTPLPLHGHLL